MEKELKKLVEYIQSDYVEFMEDYEGKFDMVKIQIEYGSKYIKIIVDDFAWGFVVNVTGDCKFEYGDILKAATWLAPMRNYSRGNIFGVYELNWTGPIILRQRVDA